MNKKKTKKKMSPNHNGPKGYNGTLAQVKLRVELLNQFIDEGVPDGFTAHTSLKALIAYSDGEYIESRSYPAIHAKKRVLIRDIDPKYKGHPNAVVDCKDYLKLKIEQLKDKLETDTEQSSISEQSLDNKVQEGVESASLNDKPKVKTKGELRNTIKEQAVLIESLAREVLLQRSANNSLISLLRERDKSGRALKPYYEQHQQSLCDYREKITPNLRQVINNLEDVAAEFDEVFGNTLDNVVSLWEK
ncbi:hypothetical protein [Vibrio hyugaensis]|uniref:hypothetical protein n=1 Tax=Vibrio hyugaensis TaxID=1534743 RepID=UPI000CE31150|nr:hypothetical protein [Vibrio hyugaensis]